MWVRCWAKSAKKVMKTFCLGCMVTYSGLAAIKKKLVKKIWAGKNKMNDQ